MIVFLLTVALIGRRWLVRCFRLRPLEHSQSE